MDSESNITSGGEDLPYGKGLDINSLIEPPIEVENKTPKDYGREFAAYLEDAVEGAQAIWASWDRVWRDRQLPPEWDEAKKDFEYNMGALQHTVVHWQNHCDEFFLKYSRENLRTSFDLMECKEFKSAYRELEARARFDREAIARLEANPSKPAPLSVQKGPGKIRWLGTNTEAALVFQYLAGAGLIQSNWSQLVQAHFEQRDGTPMSQNLPQLVAKADGKTEAERRRIATELKGALAGQAIEPPKRA